MNTCQKKILLIATAVKQRAGFINRMNCTKIIVSYQFQCCYHNKRHTTLVYCISLGEPSVPSSTRLLTCDVQN